MEALTTIALSSLAAISSLVGVGIIFLNSKGLLRVVATENKRRQNREAIPLLGGLGIAVAFAVSLILFWSIGYLESLKLNPLPLLLALSIAGITGVLDDIYEIKPKIKLAGQLAICFLALWAVKDTLSPPRALVGDHELLVQLITFAWVFGLLNSVNLLDGLDGLASGVSLIAIVALQFLTSNSHSLPFTFAIVASISGFFLLNRFPAKIYLGEVGTLTIGLMVFTCTMLFQTNASGATTFWGAFLPTSILVVDTGMAIIRRFMRGTSLLKGDRDHIHHCLLRVGFSHPQTVTIIHATCLFYFLYAWKVVRTDDFTAIDTIVLAMPLGFSVLLFRYMESKLVDHISNSSFQILQMIDKEILARDKLHAKLLEVKSDQKHFLLYRFNIDRTLAQLLELSPLKLRDFYPALITEISKDGYRQAFLETSKSLVIVVNTRIHNLRISHQSLLIEDLEKFETREKIDLKLDEEGVLKELSLKDQSLLEIESKEQIAL